MVGGMGPDSDDATPLAGTSKRFRYVDVGSLFSFILFLLDSTLLSIQHPQPEFRLNPQM